MRVCSSLPLTVRFAVGFSLLAVMSVVHLPLDAAFGRSALRRVPLRKSMT